MTQRNDIQAIEIIDAFENGVARLGADPNGCGDGVGAVCMMGNGWFYFGGIEAEEATPEEYMENVPMSDIAREIEDALKGIRSEFPDEWDYYRALIDEMAM